PPQHLASFPTRRSSDLDQIPPYPGARSTPTVDGPLLYALGSDGDLACLETATGKPRWRKNLRTDFGGRPGIWAYAESPLIDGEVDRKSTRLNSSHRTIS